MVMYANEVETEEILPEIKPLHLWSCSVLISLKLNFIDHKKFKVYITESLSCHAWKILDLKEVEMAFFLLININ